MQGERHADSTREQVICCTRCRLLRLLQHPLRPQLRLMTTRVHGFDGKNDGLRSLLRNLIYIPLFRSLALVCETCC